MRRIELTDYDYPIVKRVQDAMGNASEVEGAATLSVRHWLVRICLSPACGHGPEELLDMLTIMQRVKACAEPFILLEESEWRAVCDALKKLRGYGQQEAEILRRVLKADSVEVQPRV